MELSFSVGECKISDQCQPSSHFVSEGMYCKHLEVGSPAAVNLHRELPKVLSGGEGVRGGQGVCGLYANGALCLAASQLFLRICHSA